MRKKDLQKIPWKMRQKNKPNSNPNKPNSNPISAQTNPNKPNSNPKRTQFQNRQNMNLTPYPENSYTPPQAPASSRRFYPEPKPPTNSSNPPGPRRTRTYFHFSLNSESNRIIPLYSRPASRRGATCALVLLRIWLSPHAVGSSLHKNHH